MGKPLQLQETVSGSEDPPLADPSQVAQAARAVARIVRTDWPEGQTNKLPALLLRALCQLAEDSATDPNEGWEPPAIAAAMTDLGAPWRNLPAKEARERVNQHWKALDAVWNDRRADLCHRLVGDGVVLEPELDKPPNRGGRGNRARYRLRFFDPPRVVAAVAQDEEAVPEPSIARDLGHRDVAVADSAISRPATPSVPAVQAIHYHPVDIALPRLLRWIPADGLWMGSWFGRVLAVAVTSLATILVLMALGAFLLLQYTPQVFGFLKMATSIATFLGLTWLGFGWWWSLLENRVARAPWWWQPLSLYGDNVIEQRLDPRGATPSRLHLVRYVADCPLCGDEGPGRSAVRLASGRLAFIGRIVGRCRHAPNEHVWSFDHITRRGRFLR